MRVKELERRTGINLEHYYKINKRKECSRDDDLSAVGEGLSKRKKGSLRK